MNKGIAAAGNILVDYVKTIDRLPASGMLANISDVRRSVGGCVPNTLINLARMDGGIPLRAVGRVGCDENGDYVLSRMRDAGVDTGGVLRTEGAITSFSDAMCARDSGERTFFHHRGANARFCPEDAPPERLVCDILHVGYILLLDRMDEADAEYGTVLARYLHDVRQRGIRTSVDVVSDSAGRFSLTVAPSLRYCDYAVMNEVEACAVCDLPARDAEGRLRIEHIRRALEYFLSLGVRERAVIHAPEGGFCMDAHEGYFATPSLRLPKGYIRGSVGAGDAFCAGCLHEIYNGNGAEDMLLFASAAAAVSLSAADSVGGMKSEKEISEMIKSGEWGTL